MSQSKCKYIKKEGSSCSLNNKCKYPNCEMDDKTKLQNALNFARSELANEKLKKLTKTINYSKIDFIQKLINKLI